MNHVNLPEIPVIDLKDRPLAALVAVRPDDGNAILTMQARKVTQLGVWLMDQASKSWGEDHHLPYGDEIDTVSKSLQKSGAWLMNLYLEWGCSTGVVERPDAPPQLRRVLDANLYGLGRWIVAAQRIGRAGPYTALTWAGFVGILQASAPRRFAAAINQAPEAYHGYGKLIDWGLNRVGMMKADGVPPALLLRQVFDEARTYAEAYQILTETPVTTPVFFTLAGCQAGEAVVIARNGKTAIVHQKPAAITNHWLASDGLRTQSTAHQTKERYSALCQGLAEPEKPWQVAPIIGPKTRLVMTATPATGALSAQGWENGGAVTSVLDIS